MSSTTKGHMWDDDYGPRKSDEIEKEEDNKEEKDD